MKLSPIAVAVAAALFSLGAVAQDKPKDSSMQTPSATQEQKPSSDASSSSAASGGSAPSASSTEKKEGSAAAGASGAKAKSQAAAGSGGNADMIKQVQTKLNEMGHDVGTPDGKMGPKTQKGLKEFQASKGLKETGQIDQETLAALGISGSAAGGASKAPKAETKSDSSASGASTSPAAPQSPAPAEKPGEKKY